MALTPSFKASIVARLPAKYKEQYDAGDITDAQLGLFASRIGITPPADFSNVKKSSTSTEATTPVPTRPSAIDDLKAAGSRVSESAVGGYKTSVGAAQFTDADTATARDRADVNIPFISSGIRYVRDRVAEAMGDDPNAVVSREEQIRGLMASPTSGTLSGRLSRAEAEARIDSASRSIDGQRASGRATFEEGQAQRANADAIGSTIDRGLIRNVSQPVADVAGSPSSLLSIPGGAFAAIPAADVYNQEYTQARLAGLSEDDARTRATTMAGIEGGVSAVPTGRLFSVGGKRLIAPSLDRAVSRVVGTGLKEGVSEGVTTLAQEAANSGFRAYGNTEQSTYANARASVDLWSDFKRSVAAGFVGGSGVQSASVGFEIAAENGRRAAELSSGDKKFGAPIREAADVAAVRAQDTDTAFRQREAGVPVVGDQRIADEKEAGFLTMELRRQAEQLNPGNPMVEQLKNFTVTPETVARERQANTQLDADIAAEQARLRKEEQLAPYRQEAEKAINKTFASELVKAKAKHQADKRKSATTAIEQAKKLPEAERIGYVATKRMEWDAVNPAPTQEAIKAKYATTQQPAAPATTVAAPAVAQAPAVGQTSDVMSEGAIRQFGMSSTTEQAPSRNKASDVVASIRSKVGSSREAASLGRLIADGKLVVLDRAEQLPNYTPDLQDTNGFYDGERMYIMANQLDPTNIKGSALVVAAHEAKHAADLSGAGKTGTTSIGQFVGEQANDAINAKIVDEASNGGVAATFAVEAVKGMNPATAKLELPAYYVTASMKNRAERGAVSGALGDIVSAIRTKFGSDVNLNDVGYMANKLVENIAVGKESISGKTDGMQMVVGESYPGFKDRESQGLTYTDYDGSKKTLISDSEATINVEAVVSLLEGGEVSFSKLVDAPSIKSYGALASDIKVRVNDALQSMSAQLLPTPTGLTVELSTSLATYVDADPSHVKQILLHEMQHAVQYSEGFARGGSPEEFYTSEDARTLNAQKESEQEVLRFVNKVFRMKGDMGKWPISYTTKNMIGNTMADYDARLLTSMEAVDNIKGILELSDTESSEVNNAASSFRAVAMKNAALNIRAREIRGNAYTKYTRLLGEREARFTQENSRRTQADLDAALRPRYYGEIGIVRGWEAPTFFDVPAPADVSAWNVGLASKVSVPSKPGRLTEEMLNEVKAAVKGNRSVFTAKNAMGQFSGFGVLGRKLGNIKELADGEAASIAYVAEGDYYRAKFGIKKMAKRRGMPLTKANDEVNNILKEAGRIEDVTRREAFVSRYAAANPELRPLVDALDNIAKQSKDIVAARVKDPRQFTEDELAKYSAIIKNRYTYFTRTYAAFQGKEGEVRNRRLQREAILANAQVSKGKPMSPKYSHAAQIYNNAVRFVVNNDLAVFDPEMLIQQSLDRIDYLYSTWIGDPEALRAQIRNDPSIRGDAKRRKAYRAAAEAAISTAGATVNKDAINREAEFIVNGMLGLNESSNPVISYYRGMKEDRSILKSREEVPQQVRDLFGEIEDLPTKIAITLAKQGELAARMRMLGTIHEQGDGKWYVSPEKFRSGDQYARFTEQLSGDAWGPLDGARVTPEIAAALNDGLDIFTPLSNALAQGHATVDRAAESMSVWWMAGLRRASSVQKFIQIVLSPFNIGANYLGSWAVVAQNGGAMPDDMLRAMKASSRMLVNQVAPGGGMVPLVGSIKPMTRDPDLELFLKYTLLDSAVGQELRSTPSKFLKQLVVELESATTLSKANKLLTKAGEKAGNAKGFITEMFALSDAWVKPAVFLSRARFLERINKAENKGWTQDEIYQQAADLTKDTTITFQRGAPAIKLAERLPITWYATYIQGVFRSMTYSFAQGTKDFISAANATTPEGKLLYALEGAKRLAGATAASIGAAMATKAVAALFNDEEDEEYLEGAKKLLYAEGRYGDGIYLGKNEKDAPVFLRLSRLDPNGPVNDMIRIALSPDDAETKTRAIMEHIEGLWIKPRTTADVGRLVFSVFTDDPVKNKKTKIERLLPKATNAFKTNLPADYGTAEAAMQFIDGFVPGAANAFDQESARPTKDHDTLQWILANTMLLTGGRVDVADAGLASFGAGNKLDTLQKEGRSQIAEAFHVGGAQAALSRYDDLREGELNAFYKLKDVYDGLVQMGNSPRQAAAMLKDNKVQAQDIALIMKGRIPDDATGLLDKDSLIKSAKIGIDKLPKDQQAKAKKDFERSVNQLLLLKDRRD